jgi:hypothetical protein
MNRLVSAGVVAALSFQLAASGKGADQSDKPAFPEAQGFGAYSQGGRGGEITS